MNLENVADIYALSPMQEGMLFHRINEPASPVYFQQYTCLLSGDLHIAFLKTAWQQAVDRHPVLRTAFLWEELDAPLQIVREQVELPWPVLDWQDLTKPEQQHSLNTFLENDRIQGLDLAQAPLLRVTIIQMGADHHQLVMSFSHMVLDGWSMRLVFQEVFTTYEALTQGTVASWPTPRPYRDYIGWLQEQDHTEAEIFWKETLKGFTVPTPLGLDKKTNAHASGYRQQQLALSEEATSALEAVARQNALTVNTFLQGAWALLLSYYSGEQDIVFGVTVAGRPAALQGFEKMVGLFINTLPLRVSASPEALLLPWLKSLQGNHVDARQYECSPLVSIQRWSDVAGGRSLFDSIVVFENHPSEIEWSDRAGYLKITDARYLEQSNYPLALLAVPGPALEMILVYQDHQFDEAIITRMLGHMNTILEEMPNRLDQQLRDVPLLTAAERQQLLVKWNNNRIDYPADQGIHQLFESQVRQNPNNIALISDQEQLTYHDLNKRANQWAHYLISQGLQQGDRVAICLDRSVEMIVALLSVVKAGGAYIPLDPDYPQARLAYILEDAGVSMVLTRQDLSGRIAGDQVRSLLMDTDQAAVAQVSEENPPHGIHPDDLAYVMYTSGSTGAPRGVQITHRNLVHSNTARMHYYPDPVGRFLLRSAFAFDSSAVGIYWALCQGGTLVLPPQGEEQDIPKLTRRIADAQITHMLALPALYDLMLTFAPVEMLASLQTVIVAGEACPAALPARHYDRLPQCTLYNEYGPTEGTIWSSVFRIPKNWAGVSVPIGCPIPNTSLFILDACLRPVPVGVAGELCIGGEGVARGYLNQPEETAERFIPHHFGTDESVRLYKTGDLARYLEDGCIEFIGRKDHQVKIRGHRIELEEIEATLAQHPALQEAAVVVRATKLPDTDDPAKDLNTDALFNRLTALDPDEADQLLKEIEALHDA